MLITKFIRILIFFLLFNNFSFLKADTKKNIIDNINNSETITFDFIQTVNNKEENGVCYLRRPHYLKCKYSDKNQKELIVNRKQLVIYHKRYNKIYSYPLSKSYFNEILDKKKFSEMIDKGIVRKENNTYLVNCFLEEKGEILFYFSSKNFDLKGWDLNSLNDSKIIFKILNSVKNTEIKKTFFDIPKLN